MSAPFGPAQFALGAHHETADEYTRVVCLLADRWRVVVCKDNDQWIIQRHENGTAKRPWRGVSYHRTKKALVERCGALCGQIDPAAMAALDQVRGKPSPSGRGRMSMQILLASVYFVR